MEAKKKEKKKRKENTARVLRSFFARAINGYFKPESFDDALDRRKVVEGIPCVHELGSTEDQSVRKARHVPCGDPRGRLASTDTQFSGESLRGQGNISLSLQFGLVAVAGPCMGRARVFPGAAFQWQRWKSVSRRRMDLDLCLLRF